MALLSGKKKPLTKKPQDEGRFRVVLAQDLSKHKTKADAQRALMLVKLKGNDIAFILEESDK